MYCGRQELMNSDIPKFWGLLSNADRYQYMYLRNALSSQSGKSIRNKRVENFAETLQAIKQFCIRGDGHDWCRFLVAGICWLPEGGIAVNTHQLRLLVVKCKSSINGSLHKMGYNYGMERPEAAAAIIRQIPLLKDNPAELRQWTARLDQPVACSPPTTSPISQPQNIQVPQPQNVEIFVQEAIAPQHDLVSNQSKDVVCSEFTDASFLDFSDEFDLGLDSSFGV